MEEEEERAGVYQQPEEHSNEEKKLKENNEEQPPINTQPSQIDSKEEEKKEQIVCTTQSYENDSVENLQAKNEEQHPPSITQSSIHSSEETLLEKSEEQPSPNTLSEIDDSVKLAEGSEIVVSKETDVDDDAMVAEDVTPIVVEGAPSVLAKGIPPVDVPLMGSVDIPVIAAEDAREVVAKDAHAIVAEHSPSEKDTPIDEPPVQGEGARTMVAEDAPGDIHSAVAEHVPIDAGFIDADVETMDAIHIAEDPPSVVSEDETSIVAEVAVPPALVAEDVCAFPSSEDTPSATSENARYVTGEAIPPALIADDAPTQAIPISEVISEDARLVGEAVTAVLNMATEEAHPKISEVGPLVIVEDVTPMASENAQPKVPMTSEKVPPRVPMASENAAPENDEDAPAVVAVDAPPKIADDAPSVAEDASAVAVVDAIPMVAEDAPSVVVEDATPMVAEYPHTVVSGDATRTIENSSSLVDENASTTLAEDDSPMVGGDESLVVDEFASRMSSEEVAHASEVDTEMEMETEMEAEAVETGSNGKKRKRGRPPKTQARAPLPKITEEEDVCFICFDGGNLVLCDRRGCPKAYHPACVNRDEAFFRSRGRWNCGWHICSNCERGAKYMCYTCTYSLCKGCIKEADFACARGNKGFCETCMRTVMLIEKNEQAQVNFDDKSSWEYLFKEYWVDLKGKLSLTVDELTQAKNPFKESNMLARKGDSSEELYDANDDKGSDSDGSTGHVEVSNSKRRKSKKQSKFSKEDEPSSVTHSVGEGTSLSSDAEWASKDLLDFVAHMKNGDKSALSQFDVQALLLDYIKTNNLRDPRKKSQIICDSRLENLFGKPRVGHFEMLKLLESHFLVKEDTHADDVQRAHADIEGNQLDGDGTPGSLTRSSSDKRRKSRRKGDGRGPQTNLDDYAAIDVDNIKLLYLRRNLMEDLLEDSDKFQDTVAGSFVRIRISGSGQKQDMYRLVQVIGTRKAAEPYKTGKRSADVVLEILNLNKTEVISIDTISNQDFSEDECKRLRQSIKCGLISRMSVGEVQEKAIALQAVRVNDWLETEKLRISHLRDRASEQGRRKDLRECVEKLQLLNTPEERSRRLQQIPQVHADPKMDPNYVSEEEDEQDDNRSHDNGVTPRDSGGFTTRTPISPGKGSPASLDTWSGSRKSSTTTTGSDSATTARNFSARDRSYGGGVEPASNDPQIYMNNNSWDTPKNLAPTFASTVEPAAANISETDKMWHYQDPSKKVQGPFSMAQLRKWSTTGHFPVDLRIWRTTEKQQDSILLTDALLGKYTKEAPPLPLPVVSTHHRVERPVINTWTDQNRTTSNSNWEVSGGGSSGYAANNGSSVDASSGGGWNSPTPDSGRGWNSPTPDSGRGGGWGNNPNAWGGRSSYSVQPQRPAFSQGGHGGGGGGGGRWNNRDQSRGNNWNSNRQNHNRGGGQHYNNNNNNNNSSSSSSGRGGGGWGDSRGWSNNTEPPKSVMTEGWGNRSNFPSPTPPNTTSSSAWNTEQQWSPTPGAAGNNGGWGQRPVPISLPNHQDYSSPPTPTPPTPTPAGNYVHPH